MKLLNSFAGAVDELGLVASKPLVDPYLCDALNADFFDTYQSEIGAFSNSRHIYYTDDTVATMNTAAYFNGVGDRLKVGDKIDVVVLSAAPTKSTNINSATVSAAATLWVNAVSGSKMAGYTVDVSDGDSVTLTDTD